MRGFSIESCLLLTRFPCSLIESEATVGRNATFFQSLTFNKDLGATRGIDFVLKAHNLDAIVLPAPGLTTTPAGAVLLIFLLVSHGLRAF